MKNRIDSIAPVGCPAPPCSPGLTDVETELRKMVPHLRGPAPDAAKVIELAADIVAMAGKSEAEVIRLRHGIDCAVNALTDSILCSGNDGATNLHFVRKLKSLLSQANDQAQLRAENHAAGENEAAPSGALADAPCSALSADVTP